MLLSINYFFGETDIFIKYRVREIFTLSNLCSFELQMDYLLASSRGGGVANCMGAGYHLVPHVLPGGTYKKLADKATEVLPDSTVDHESKNHVYVLAGVPDITTLVRSSPKHMECIYTDTPEHTLKHLKEQIDECADAITKKNAIPIFCTITPMNITLYNNYLLEDNKTKYLLHAEKYDHMQAQILPIFTEINRYIKTYNTDRGFTTPMCQFEIVKRHGKGRKGYYRNHWEGLKDGLHATEKTRKGWATAIRVAINKNRQQLTRTATFLSSSSEDETPKRAWKREREDL